MSAHVLHGLTHTNACSYAGCMAAHEYEARCACGQRWRVYSEDDEDDEPMATCTACGADTFDLSDMGEVRSAGRDMLLRTLRQILDYRSARRCLGNVPHVR